MHGATVSVWIGDFNPTPLVDRSRHRQPTFAPHLHWGSSLCVHREAASVPEWIRTTNLQDRNLMLCPLSYEDNADFRQGHPLAPSDSAVPCGPDPLGCRALRTQCAACFFHRRNARVNALPARCHACSRLDLNQHLRLKVDGVLSVRSTGTRQPVCAGGLSTRFTPRRCAQQGRVAHVGFEPTFFTLRM